jgi:aldehyde dehydrogenase (NAD+)/gamma-glutamyl-gamma-aminobutyraldehyde dehydrogenase
MRQLVHEKIKDDYLDAISKKAKSIKVGDPLDPTSEMGSMVSEEHLVRVNTYIQKGIEEGAQVVFGGTDNPLGRGYYANPTLFDNLEENMVIAREEIFGPVLGIMTVKSMEDAIRIANDSQYGLHASVFTQDIGKAFHLSKALKCGTVSINSFSEGDIKTPFGGYKQSGSLSRDNGTEALDQYLQIKTIWVNLD